MTVIFTDGDKWEEFSNVPKSVCKSIATIIREATNNDIAHAEGECFDEIFSTRDT